MSISIQRVFLALVGFGRLKAKASISLRLRKGELGLINSKMDHFGDERADFLSFPSLGTSQRYFLLNEKTRLFI